MNILEKQLALATGSSPPRCAATVWARAAARATSGGHATRGTSPCKDVFCGFHEAAPTVALKSARRVGRVRQLLNVNYSTTHERMIDPAPNIAVNL
jgi:hypothetical protein